jgi:branched-chain amino acid transport system ATP-binding protein
MSILEVREITSGYGEVQILWGTSLRLQEGKLTCLVGGNGSGKTTLMRTIMGQIHPWSGSIWFEGKDISRMPAHIKTGMGLVMVPEGRHLFTDMTVYENLEMGATAQRARSRMKENLDKIYEMFPRLKERRNQEAGTLSGGEQQMLAVARGIIADPRVLLIDELSLGLAPKLVLELFKALMQLRDLNLTILLVEQNIQTALAISDYGFVLSEGKIQLEGPAKQLVKNEHIRITYLGL